MVWCGVVLCCAVCAVLCYTVFKTIMNHCTHSHLILTSFSPHSHLPSFLPFVPFVPSSALRFLFVLFVNSLRYNGSLGFKARVNLILAQLTTAEKMTILSQVRKEMYLVLY